MDNANHDSELQNEVPPNLVELIREFYKDLVISHDKQLESNSEDEGSSDEERQRYLEEKAARIAKAEEARKAKNSLAVDPNAPWDSSAQKPKRKQRKKRKGLKDAEESVSEDEIFEFSVPEGDPFDSFTPVAARMFAMYLTYGAINEADQLSEDFELEVDIEYVVASFLSHFLIQRAGIPDDAVYVTTPRVLHSFLTCVRTLNALPEYETQVLAAIEVAKKALVELPLVKAINTDELPYVARFHTACYELFIANDNADLEKLEEQAKKEQTESATKQSTAGIIDSIKEALADYSDLVHKLGKETSLRGIRVVRRTQPIFVTIGAIDVNKVEGYGALQLAPYVSPDLSEDDQAEASMTVQEIELFLPRELAQKLQPGMKMDGSFYELSNSIWFGDPLTLFPSYFRRMVEVQDDALFT
ncbi:hypothetical protein BGW42_003407 [Actinomortierella wolfii]|nr:hypothetical protein BGW42_003407 [Actinomortierella wolfii]